ncbi:MAG: hypothetical protein AAF950_07315 [Pseudomonadota bacterium]
MSRYEKYTTLMASLPHPGPLFAEKQTPISRLQLDRRLRQLSDEDAALLNAIEQALEWRYLDTDNDASVVKRVRRALALTDSSALQALIKRRMEIKTCISALRRRAAGEGAPSAQEVWGYGALQNQIVTNWTSQTFNLDRLFPWLKEASRLIDEGDAYALEQLILEVSYRDLCRRAGLHQFDIEAVIIYVLKWSVMDVWSRNNSEAASRRFSDLLNASLTATDYPAKSDIQPVGATA